MMDWGGAWRFDRRSEVRSARDDSGICDWGRIWVTVSTASLEAVKARRLPVAPRLVALEASGIIPREARPEMACASSGVQTVLFMLSRRKAKPTPEMRPSTSAKDKLSGRLGSRWEGVTGGAVSVGAGTGWWG